MCEEKTIAERLDRLVVHAVAHCAGYDHERDDEAAAMESVEARLLAAAASAFTADPAGGEYP